MRAVRAKKPSIKNAEAILRRGRELVEAERAKEAAARKKENKKNQS